MRTKWSVAAILMVAALFFLSSCIVREELFIDADGSGTGTLSIHLNPILLSYYSDLLTAMTGVPGDYPVFDLEQMEQAFAERPGIELVAIERSALGQLQMEIAFDNANAITQATGDVVTPAEVFEFTQVGSQRKLTVRLDRDAINSFLSFAPPESAMLSDFLFPPDDGSVSRREYQEELAWALEEYAPPEEVERVLDNAEIQVVIAPAGRIVSQSGGRIQGEAVVFTVSILDVLTLADERVYELVFVP